MTPGERVVVEAAIRWASLWERRPTGNHTALHDAVQALLAERAGPAPELVEITWGQVAEGDQIYRGPGGCALPELIGGTWHEVTRAGLLAGTDRVRINARGISRPIQPEAAKKVTVKRGVTGDAVDMFASVLWSMPTLPDQPGASAPIDAHDVAKDPEAAAPEPESEESSDD